MSERSQDVYAEQIGPGNIQVARTSALGKQQPLESKGATVCKAYRLRPRIQGGCLDSSQDLDALLCVPFRKLDVYTAAAIDTVRQSLPKSLDYSPGFFHRKQPDTNSSAETYYT